MIGEAPMDEKDGPVAAGPQAGQPKVAARR
jgi:hypothetical protein